MADALTLYLASRSPRRRVLLEQIQVGYRPLAVAVDETPHGSEAPEAYVQRLALAKAAAGLALIGVDWPRRPVLGADTAVVIDDTILGKPQSQAEGLAMLAQLAGRRHRVMTAIALADGERSEVALSVSQVELAPLSEAECRAYWATGEGWDKAGGYAIQGVAARFVVRLEGSYSGVMGLPLYELHRLLGRFPGANDP